jgi:hypothetical protein
MGDEEMKILLLTLVVAMGATYLHAVEQAPKPAPAEVIASMPEEAPVVPSSVTQAPEWLVKSLELVSSVPVVGPVVVEVAKWLGVVSSVLTILVTALLGVLRVLSLVLPAVKLANLLSLVVALENSKVLYWLKFFSIYNVQKKTEPPVKP